MARLIILGIATVLAVLFLIQMKRGVTYENIVSGLDEMEYPLCELYVVGFGWSTFKLLQFRGKLAAKLKQQASLLFEEQYADYYANVAWAQTITFIHLALTVTLLLTSIFFANYKFILLLGGFITLLAGVYGLTNMQNQVNSRKEECDAQLAEIVSTMAVLLHSGMVLREVWQLVGRSGDGVIYELMQKTTENMNNGLSEIDAIYQFGRMSGSAEVQKFTSAMLQSMEKGGNELAHFMENQSSELWNLKRQRVLQLGEKAATKLLLPIVLIFLGVMIIIMTAAFAGMLF